MILKWIRHKKIANANPVELHQKINQLNAERSYYKGKIGLNDIRILVGEAKEIPGDIKY